VLPGGRQLTKSLFPMLRPVRMPFGCSEAGKLLSLVE
jgi:hypothetical protein